MNMHIAQESKTVLRILMQFWVHVITNMGGLVVTSWCVVLADLSSHPA